MEVHAHTHAHGKKTWKSYFWEFLMLFLAVTLGFFVENQTSSVLLLNVRMPDGRPFFSKKIGPGTVEVALPSLPAGA